MKESYQMQWNGYFFSTDQSLLAIDTIHSFLSQEAYWCRHIPAAVVQKAIQQSLNFGVYQDKQQVAYARIITDYATIAYLGDVFVLKDHRGKGISKKLMQFINEHPSLQSLRRWVLLTRDAHGLYEQFGWKPVADSSRWMEKHNPTIYLP